MKKGDRIRLNDTDWQGVIVNVLPGDIAVVILDNGIEMRCPAGRITLVGNNTDKATSPASNNGRFTPGHPRLGGRKKGQSVRQTRKELLAQLQPYISDIGSIIALIDAPEDKILAVARMMRYCVPTYSSVEFSETAPRSLSAEEKLAQLNARYNHLPDPTEKDNDEDEEEAEE